MTLEELHKKYFSLANGVIDYEKFNHFSLSHHSTAIEGSTLTEIETQVFLQDGTTAKGKPLHDHLMIKNHYEALLFILEEVQKKRELTIPFIQEISAKVMKDTGTTINTPLGSFDSSKGDFRLVNVFAGNHTFINYSKVIPYMKDFCEDFGKRISTLKTIKEINECAFLLHYQFVSIHPFVDGNGRTARLLMNYIQAYHHQPMTVISKENKVDYINALTETREKEDTQIFVDFMNKQHEKHIIDEIKKLEPSVEIKTSKGIRFIF